MKKRKLRRVAARYRWDRLKVRFWFAQLVEMATRAMSPAINDPITAMTCLDYIGEGLGLFIQHGEKSLIQAESLAGALVEKDRQAIRLRCEALQMKLEASR
jgi:uncharacterized membrane protein